MKTSIKELDVILRDILHEKDHSKSRFSISSYGSQGKKYLYLYRIQRNNGGA